MAENKVLHQYTSHDFSAVNHHVNELSRRASVTTSARRADVFKTYATYGAVLALALGFGGWLVLLGIAELLDPKPEIIEKEVVVEKPVAFEPNIFVTQQGTDAAAVDATRDEARSVVSEISGDENSTTYNFVVFKEVPFTKEGFTKIMLGMQYLDSNAKLPSEQWCYIERPTGIKTRNSINLARMNGRKRTNTQITLEDANNMSTTRGALLEAQALCDFR